MGTEKSPSVDRFLCRSAPPLFRARERLHQARQSGRSASADRHANADQHQASTHEQTSNFRLPSASRMPISRLRRVRVYTQQQRHRRGNCQQHEREGRSCHRLVVHLLSQRFTGAAWRALSRPMASPSTTGSVALLTPSSRPVAPRPSASSALTDRSARRRAIGREVAGRASRSRPGVPHGRSG